MKKYLTILVAILLNAVSYGQPTSITWSFHIADLNIIPAYPLPGENVKVAFTISTFQGASYEGYSVAINASEIKVNVCMGIYMTSESLVFEDTIDVGIFTEGVYNLTFKGYGDYAPPVCDVYSESADSAWIDTTFNVSITNEIFSVERNEMSSIFPNPTNSCLFIYLDSDVVVKEIFVRDITGRVIINVVAPISVKDLFEINTSHIPDGVYFLEIISDKRRYFEKFVKTS